MIWLLLGAYVACALIGWRLLAGHWAYHFLEQNRIQYPNRRRGVTPNGEQWFGAFLVAGMATAVWPLVLLWYGVGKCWKIGSEARGSREAMQRRIAELEREAGLQDE